jgi:hypothetical protein
MPLCSAAFEDCRSLWTVGKRGATSCEPLYIGERLPFFLLPFDGQDESKSGFE